MLQPDLSMRLSQQIAIALGSEYVRIVSDKDKKIVSFPSYITVTKENREVVAVGEEARKMVGKVPNNLLAFNILQEGTPGDQELFEKFLRYCLTKTSRGRLSLFPPKIIITGFLQNEGARISLKEGVIKSGAREVRLLEPGVAAAIGLGLSIEKPDFHCTLIFERDWAIYTAISLSGVVVQRKLNIGLDNLIEDLSVYLMDAKNFQPSKEDLRDRILRSGFSSTAGLIGWDRWISEIQSGHLRSEDVDQEDMTKGISPAFLRAVHQITEIHSELEKEKALKVANAPIYLAGDFSGVPGLDKLLKNYLGREIIRKDDAQLAVIKGALVVLESLVWLMRMKK